MNLEEIYRPIEPDLDRVYVLLQAEMNRAVEHGGGASSDKFTRKAVGYLLSKPGKHLRPALAVFSARTVSSETPESCIHISAVLELIHSASLVHDDIIDEAEKRRNLPAVHRKFGAKIAILVGDILYTQAFSIVANLPDTSDETKIRLFKLLTDLTKRMCYGEIFEQDILKKSSRVKEEDYLRILNFKTALLMSVACRCGAILAGSGREAEEKLASFGLNFGYVYQLADDYKDGDSIFRGPPDLITLAEDFYRRIETDLDGFGDAGIIQSMRNLAKHILPSDS